MGTKNSGIKCYDNAAPDEPLFVLRAVDPATPNAIRAWAKEALRVGHRQEKIDEALAYAAEVESWQKANLERMRTPENASIEERDLSFKAELLDRIENRAGEWLDRMMPKNPSLDNGEVATLEFALNTYGYGEKEERIYGLTVKETFEGEAL
jgi:hypothetical protein